MHKKSWFSFLEMLIVIMIVGILFVSFRWSFQIKNKEILYGQACIETLYGQVNNFLHAGLSSKSLLSGTTRFFPDTYIITFSPLYQKILMSYEEEGNTNFYSSIEITGNMNINYCVSNSYTIRLSWDNYALHINKGLQENQNLQFFFISGMNWVSTGETVFWQCDIQWTWCKKMARFETDIRTIQLKKYICLSFTETGDCREWDN